MISSATGWRGGGGSGERWREESEVVQPVAASTRWRDGSGGGGRAGEESERRRCGGNGDPARRRENPLRERSNAAQQGNSGGTPVASAPHFPVAIAPAPTENPPATPALPGVGGESTRTAPAASYCHPMERNRILIGPSASDCAKRTHPPFRMARSVAKQVDTLAAPSSLAARHLASAAALLFADVAMTAARECCASQICTHPARSDSLASDLNLPDGTQRADLLIPLPAAATSCPSHGRWRRPLIFQSPAATDAGAKRAVDPEACNSDWVFLFRTLKCCAWPEY